MENIKAMKRKRQMIKHPDHYFFKRKCPKNNGCAPSS